MKKSLLLGFALLLALLVLDAGMTLRTAAQLRANQARIVEVAGIRIELRALLAAYVDAETGERGFLLTGDNTYLEPYDAARAALARSDDRLKSLLIPEKNLAEFRGLIEEHGVKKMAFLEYAIAEQRAHGTEAALAVVRAGHAKTLMDNIRAIAAKLDAELAARLKDMLATAEQRLAFTTNLNFSTHVLLACMLVGLFFLARLHFREREKATEAERISHASVESLLVSEREAHNEANRANKLKDEFLAVVSHELRTPLNAILGWTTLLREGAEDEIELKEGLETIDRNAHAQARLIEDLLDVSRIISGKVRLRISEVELRTLTLGVLEGLRPAADARGVKVTLLANDESAEVLGDPDRLEQVVWNLVNNAIKFTPRGGHVEISLKRVGSSVSLEVHDNGQGIRADFLPRIFDRFSRQDASTTRDQSGLGLGLSIARHLVELHGGTISASSEGEGRGATFRVQIPMIAVRELKGQLQDRDAVPSRPPAKTVPAIPNARLDGLRILVVDDQTDTLTVIHRVLTRAGAEVRAASSVAEALTVLGEWKPGCIISDVGMPGRDGYSFIRELRAMPPPLRTVPAIALTAFARDSDRARASEAGFNDHVAKPVDTAALLQKVATLTQRV